MTLVHTDGMSPVAYCIAGTGAEGKSNGNPFGQVITLALKSNTLR